MKGHETWSIGQHLAVLAVVIYRQRNAARCPAKYRVQVRAKARPHLREAIYWARQARDARQAEDRALVGALLDRAWGSVLLAGLELNDRYLQQGRKQAVAAAGRSSSGGKAKAKDRLDAEQKALLHEFDMVVRGFINRKEPYRVKEWLADYPFLKKTAMYERIRKIKKGG